jgi:DNA-binding NarL/FixJ family response regulator
MTTRVVIVDNSREFLDVAERALRRYPSVDVAGRAASGAEAVALAARLHPDLILLDIAMPGLNGLEAARLMKASPEPPRVVLVTLHDEPGYRAAAEAAGCDGFIAKSELRDGLARLFGAASATGRPP